ncbi:protein of unknown function [Pararobbsia alpina]
MFFGPQACASQHQVSRLRRVSEAFDGRPLARLTLVSDKEYVASALCFYNSGRSLLRPPS